MRTVVFTSSVIKVTTHKITVSDDFDYSDSAELVKFVERSPSVRSPN